MALDLLRAAAPRRSLSRQALAADVALAVIATIAVLIALGRQYGGMSVVSLPVWYGFRDMRVSPEPALSWVTFVGAALTAAPLAVRRLYPVSAFLAVFAATMAAHSEITTYTFIAVIFAAYSAVAHSRYHNAALASVFVAVVIVTVAFGNTTPPLPGRFTALLVLTATAAFANVLRMWRVRVDNSAERLRRTQAEHAEATRRAVESERARIAAELHDVVTHNVSVMVVQAGAARQVLASSPDDARQALLAVEASGRAAMSELRHLLGLLAPDGSGPVGSGPAALEPGGTGPGGTDSGATGPGGTGLAASGFAASGPGGTGPAASGFAATGAGATGVADAEPASSGSASSGSVSSGLAVGALALAPQPGLGQLTTLVNRVRGAGLPVELVVPAADLSLPPGLDLAAYRIVQEALTNVLKHAPGAHASVRIEHRADDLLIDITDSPGVDGPSTPLEGVDGPSTPRGAGPATPRGGCGGRGLIGLRERVLLYGGSLDAGPRPGGGWRLRATIPLGAGAPERKSRRVHFDHQEIPA